MKSEIAYFNIWGGNYEHKDSMISKSLIEIPRNAVAGSSITFSSKKITVKISSKLFDTTAVTLRYDNDTYQNLVTINDKVFWGTDGGLPKRSIASVDCKINNKQVLIPITAYNDLFEPSFNFSSVYQSSDTKRIYIYMLNSDGAGSYEVTWIIENNRYLRRVVDYGF